MKRNKKMKKFKKRNPGRFSMMIVFMIVLVLGAWSFSKINELRAQNKRYIVQEASLVRQVEEAKQEQEELAKKESYVNSDEYIQSEAREKIGLVKENEVIFKEEQ